MRLRVLQNLGKPPAEFVSFLGKSQVRTIGLTSHAVTVSSVSIAADESIFVAFGVQSGDGVGLTGTDNLGNTYVAQKGPLAPSGFGNCGALLACLDPTPGVLTSITISWTNGLGDQGACALVAARFRNIGPARSLSVESHYVENYTANNILTEAQEASAIGISCMAVRSDGSSPVGALNPGTNIDHDNTTGGATVSNILVYLNYVQPVTADGVNMDLAWTGRFQIHVGKVYE